MPGSPSPGRLSREREELALDMILDGLSLPPEAPREMYVLPHMLADLSGTAGPDELTGEAAALSRFKVCFSPVSVSSPVSAPAPRRRSWHGSHRSRLAAAMVAVTFVLGGAAAASADMLPAPVQNLVHRVFPVPSARPAPRHPSRVTPPGHPGNPHSAVPGTARRHG
ncbi:MAG TPA: hypothetical protein VGI74_08320, partial [Streptosporangiaceae bacterium]